jgi:hypothetical protein
LGAGRQNKHRRLFTLEVQVVRSVTTPPAERHQPYAGCSLGLALAVSLTWLIGTAAAQESELAKLKASSNLSPADAAVIEQWIDQRVKTLITAEEISETARVAKQFADAYSGGTEAFQTSFAQQCIKVFGPHIGSTQTKDAAAGAMVMTLAVQSRTESLPALVQALNSPHTPARFWAAKGLAKLRRQVAASPQAVQIITSIQQAAVKETNGVALAQMFEALNLREVSGNASLAAQVGQAIVAALQAQLSRPPGAINVTSPPETTGLRVLGSVIGDIDEPSRRKAVLAAAQILSRALDQMLVKDPKEDVKRRNAVAADQAEVIIRQALRNTGYTGAVPDVMGKLKIGNTAEARAELTKLIGSDAEEGILNQLFQVPRGAGLKPAGSSETSTTQPAAE